MRHRDKLLKIKKNQPFNIKLKDVFIKYRDLFIVSIVTIKRGKNTYFFKLIYNAKGNIRKYENLLMIKS